MFLNFINFDRGFIKNFSRMTALLISIFKTIGNNNLDIQAYQNKKNQDAPNDVGSSGNDNVSRDIENLLTIIKLAKSKKPNLAKSKKSGLTKAKKLDFSKANFSETDFLTFEAKKTFIHL